MKSSQFVSVFVFQDVFGEGGGGWRGRFATERSQHSDLVAKLHRLC